MRVLRPLGSLVVGSVVAALGTVAHRGHAPWGIVVALALVLAAGVMVRAWGGWTALLGYAVGLVVVVQLLARTGPGGGVLVPAGDRLSWVWVVGSVVGVLLVAFVPRRIFDPRPRPARARADEDTAG